MRSGCDQFGWVEWVASVAQGWPEWARLERSEGGHGWGHGSAEGAGEVWNGEMWAD
ncbi:MAG: hypothetical protein HOE44_06780 [Candidatus Marinimicrobia bacterium]|nr:hypothetical protein [Candidatus Neomarinimicrobiota bacterium]